MGLAKICKKLKVPRPGVGYWRRKECGFVGKRPPLPAVTGRLALTSRIPIDPQPKPQIPDGSLPPLNIPAPNTTMHPIVTQTQRAFSGGRTDQYGRLSPSDWRLPRLDLRVTAAGFERALSFMDSLIKLLEANNMNVSVGSEREPASTRIVVDGEEIKVILNSYRLIGHALDSLRAMNLQVMLRRKPLQKHTLLDGVEDVLIFSYRGRRGWTGPSTNAIRQLERVRVRVAPESAAAQGKPRCG